MKRAVALLALGLPLGACAGYADQLERGQRYYEDNQYERALALWRDLDRRDPSFDPTERARFAYFRGMTDYRLGFRDDARHWLALAQAAHEQNAGGLEPVWLERLAGALLELERTSSSLRSDGPDVVQTIEAPPDVLPPEAPPPGAPANEPPAAEPPTTEPAPPADDPAPAVPPSAPAPAPGTAPPSPESPRAP